MQENGYEVAIVGGGISGIGVALASARAGFRTILLERGRCCAATSQSSLRIMHGGFRYFQTLDLKRILVSLADQDSLLEEYPALVRPLPCLMPLCAFGFKSRWPVSAASLAFSALSRMVTGHPAQAGVRSQESVEREVPLLCGLVRHGALYWNDALLLDPAALKDVLLAQFQEQGGVLVEDSGVEELIRHEGSWGLRASKGEYSSRVVVNCTGPWVTGLKRPADCVLFDSRWCKGFNVELNRKLEGKYAVGLQSDEGRLYFVVPRGEVSAIGTWYGAYEGKPEDMSISNQEVAEFVRGFNRAWPGINLIESDVSRIEAGVLPMKRLGRNGPVLHGSHSIASRGSYIEVLSTKYTTFRSQAAEVMRIAIALLKGS